MVDTLIQKGFADLALWVQQRGAVCKGPAQAALGRYTAQRQELCRCFALAAKAWRTEPWRAYKYEAMAAVPWELQQRIAHLAFADIQPKRR